MMTSAIRRWALVALLAGWSLATSALAQKTAGERTVHRSKDLGWKANQDVTKEFSKLLTDGTLKAGDELVLDHKYRIRGSYVLPANVTLSAVQGGGFDVTDARENQRPLLTLDNSDTLNNLTITYLNTPELGGRGIRHGVDFLDKQAISASGKHNLTIKNCRLEGMVAIHIRLDDCKKVQLIGCHIIGGFWAVTPDVTDFVARRCLFEKSCGDSMKVSLRRARVENCVFQDNGRDGLDSTGGINDSVIRNSIFRRLGVCGLDIKSHYETRTGRIEDVRPENIGIRVEKCLFHDMPNAIVLTTLDNDRRRGMKDLLTAANMKTYAPHDIEINECVFGHVETPLRPTRKGGYGVDYPKQQEYMRLILLKDAYDISYRDARTFGDRIMPVLVHSIGGSKALSREAAEAIDRSLSGNVLDEPAPPVQPGVTEVPFACGPQ